MSIGYNDRMTAVSSMPGANGGQLPAAKPLARASVVPLTIEQYQQMIEDGIVAEDSTVELLSGVMVRKDRSAIGEDPMGHSPIHRVVVVMLIELAAKLAGKGCHMQIQLPVACPPDGAPEPDAAIVRGSAKDYLDRLPGPGDVSCVIEAAHSSLELDREDKLPIYAAAGLLQYIIINLQNMTLEVYGNPDPAQGQYRTKNTVTKGDRVELKLPSGVLDIGVEEVLP
jgi:Uma2 family endonuclease